MTEKNSKQLMRKRGVTRKKWMVRLLMSDTSKLLGNKIVIIG